MDLSETIADCDLKAGKCRQTTELMKACEYSRSMPFLDRCPRSFTYWKKNKLKSEIIQSSIYRILSKVNQVINTFDTICDSNIMILAQAVLEIFCSQAYIGL